MATPNTDFVHKIKSVPPNTKFKFVLVDGTTETALDVADMRVTCPFNGKFREYTVTISLSTPNNE